MKASRLLTLTAATALMSLPALAQTVPGASSGTVGVPYTTMGNGNAGQPYNAAGEEQRDVYQQDRIENGLKDGQLSTKEASQLEHSESHIDNVEAHDMSNGSLSPAERAQIATMQNNESQKIYQDTHNSVTGNPDGKSDERMQGLVQRDANQEQRIDNGIKNGSVTNREASHLERGQAFNDRQQWRAGRDGHIGARGDRWVQARENHTSGGIYHDKHNRWKRG